MPGKNYTPEMGDNMKDDGYEVDDEYEEDEDILDTSLDSTEIETPFDMKIFDEYYRNEVASGFDDIDLWGGLEKNLRE